MQVVLNENVKGLGKKLDIVNVSEGYARNYLIPRKLASIADSKTISESSTKKEAIKFKQETERKKAMDEKEIIEKVLLDFKLKTGENGKLFGSITAKEISDQLKKNSGIEINKNKITIETIKIAGTYTAKVKLYEGVIANLKIRVINV